MCKADNLQTTKEEAQHGFVEDLLVLGKLVFHDCVCVETDALAEKLTSVALIEVGFIGLRGWMLGYCSTCSENLGVGDFGAGD